MELFFVYFKIYPNLSEILKYHLQWLILSLLYLKITNTYIWLSVHVYYVFVENTTLQFKIFMDVFDILVFVDNWTRLNPPSNYFSTSVYIRPHTLCQYNPTQIPGNYSSDSNTLANRYLAISLWLMLQHNGI